MFILVFILTLLILVLIHELGHFIAAKKFNIKVLEFGFGLPPRIWGKKIGETLISVNWLPYGGFVRLLGEDETDKKILEDKRSFAAQVVWKRIVVAGAGVIMNLLLAFILFWIVIAAQGFKVQLPLFTQHSFVGVQQTDEKFVMIGEVVPGSPAQIVGIKKGDRVISLDDQQVVDAAQLIKLTKEDSGKQIKLVLSDPGKTSFKTVEVTPRANPPLGQGPLGISLGSFYVAHLEYKTIWQKILAGPIHSFNIAGYSWEVLSQTVAYSLAKKDLTPVSQSVAGPIGITTIVKSILEVPNPLLPYLEFMAALSLNLAIVNILPFPGLDGGRLFFFFIEVITRKKTHAVVEKYIHAVGLAILLALTFLITYSDIRKLIF